MEGLVAGTAMAGDEIDLGIETADHDVAERTMRLGFASGPRRRGMLAAFGFGKAHMRKFGDGLAFAHEMKAGFLFPARRGRVAKPGLRFGHDHLLLSCSRSCLRNCRISDRCRS